jgi:hypothetical protein
MVLNYNKFKKEGVFYAILVGVLICLSIVTSASNSTGSNSSFDAVSQVNYFIKQNAKDPKSVDYIGWSKVLKETNGNFTVRVKYRAKNSFGGYAVENKLATLNSSGDVIGFIDF